MITALCANPCVDRTVSIGRLAVGGMNRITDVREDGSGKGVNVALACKQLGLQSTCVGIMATERSSLILERLKNGGCASEFVSGPGAVRVNTKVLDKSNGVITELNESGAAISSREVDAFVDAAVQWAAKSDYIVLTGSTPPGCPLDIYKTIIEKVKKAAPGCRAVLDAEGERLGKGLKARPFMIKPNRYELELLCGRKLDSIEDIHSEATKLIAQGIGLVAVSLGGDGAYITDGRQAFSAPALKVEVRSTVGAGDSMVAGLLFGLAGGKPLADVFRSGMAAAASSVTTVGTGLINVELFTEFMPQIEVRQVR